MRLVLSQGDQHLLVLGGLVLIGAFVLALIVGMVAVTFFGRGVREDVKKMDDDFEAMRSRFRRGR